MDQKELYARMPNSFQVDDFFFRRYSVRNGKNSAQIGYDIEWSGAYYALICLSDGGEINWATIGIKGDRVVPMSTRILNSGGAYHEFPLWNPAKLDRNEIVPRASAEKLAELFRSGEIRNWVS